MKKRFFILLTTFILLFVTGSRQEVLSYDRHRKDSVDLRLEQLKQLCDVQNMKDNSGEALKTAERIEQIAAHTGNQDYLLYAYVMIGQNSLFLNDTTISSEYLNKALELAVQQNNVWGITTSCSNLGILAINKENDFQKGIDYFLYGIKTAEQFHDMKQYAFLACNLAIVYHLRRDTTGLRYAETAYDYGIAHNDDYMTFSGAFTSAYMLFLCGKYQKALARIKTAEHYLEDYAYHRVSVYSTHANILSALNLDSKAEQYYLKALRYVDRTEVTSATSFYLSYGKFLSKTGNYEKAVRFLKKGVELSLHSKNSVYRYNLYNSLSEAYKHLGRPDEALRYYEAFHHEADSLFSIERERAIEEMRIKYEAERSERMIQQQKTQLLLQQRRLQLALFISILLILSLIAVYLSYRHKNRMYLLIVKQYQEAIQREKRLREHLSSDKYSSSMTEEKEKQLFTALENLMMEQHLYRRQGLNKKQLADALNTNSAYLSQAVNANTGQSLINYINNYRIDEAISLLSDMKHNTPIKAIAQDVGFTSLSVFYRTFNDKMGMSPAKYREKVIELAKMND